MKLKKWLTGVLAAAMALSLAACSDGGAESADAGSEDSITLGFAQVGSESEWRTANTDNIKAAAEAAGVTLQFSDAQQKQENQIKAIRSFIASDVDVISFCPIVETGWDTVLQEAKDAGIPVVLVDRGVTADPSLYVTHIFADALKEGANAFNWVDEYMTAEGKTPRAGGDQFQVAILEGTVGSSVAADRLQGFNDAMAESPNSGKYNVICSQTGEYTRAKGMEVMESFLKSDGDKIDILRVHQEHPFTDYLDCTKEELAVSTVSDALIDAFLRHETVDHALRRTPLDILLSHDALVFGLHDPLSRQLFIETGCPLFSALEGIRFRDDTRQRLHILQEECRRCGFPVKEVL